MDNDSTRGIRPEGLANLLALGTSDAGLGTNPPAGVSVGDLLRDRLEGTLPLAPGVRDALPVILGKLQKELLPLRGRSLGDVLLDGETPLAVFRQIKDYARQLADADSNREGAGHQSALIIYYAAIAGALLFHGEKITKFAYARLADSFGACGEQPWMPVTLVRHFAKARKLCQERE